MKRLSWGLLLLAACQEPPVAPSFATCTDATFAAGLCGGVTTPKPPPAPSGTGFSYFLANCANCHASRDGFDLAYFSYTDSNIVRRALGHVPQSEADAITAYINTLQTPQVPEDHIPWQPGGSKVASDVVFATTLFGVDAWPASLTKAQLLAKDPLITQIAVNLLCWSVEVAGTSCGPVSVEWTPDTTLATEVLTYNGNAAQTALAAYYSDPTVGNLDAVINAVSAASYGVGWCNFNSGLKHFVKCFEHHRWTSSLSAVHKLRSGTPNGFVSTTVYMDWWNVGEAARRSTGYPGQVPDRLQNQTRFHYLGWMFDPAHVPAIYTVQGFQTLGLKRHTTWIANRSAVARPTWCIKTAPGVCDEDASVSQDFRIMAANSLAGTNWSYNPANFALDRMHERINAGDRPASAADRTIAISQINGGMNALTNKVTVAEKAALQVKADAVVAGLN